MVDPVKLDSPSPPLSLSRIHRLLRPLRSSLVSFSQSFHKQATLPTTTTTSSSSSVPTFYRASKGAIQKEDSLDWKQTQTKKRKSSTVGGGGVRKRLSEEGTRVDSSPFKQTHRTKQSRRTYGSKRTNLVQTSFSQSSLFSASYASTSSSSSSSREHERGLPKLVLRKRLESCLNLNRNPSSSSSSTPTISSDLATLVNRTMNLFQAYDNILQVVYSQPRQGQVGGKVKSLLEICARDIGWEIEMNVREWLAEEEELEEDGMGEMERQINRDITRRRSHHHLSLNESLSESDDDEPSTSRRTSSSSTVTRCSTNVEEMTKGELELESSRLQDEAYESCPSHTYRWILAEHATSIVHDELSKMSEELPYEFVEIWFDWCLSYGATSEASRFHSLLISTSLAPLSSSRRSLTTTTSSIPHLLLKSPNPLSLLEQLESYLSTSTFQDRLFFHHNLVIPASLPPTPTLLSSSSSTLIGGAGGKEEWKDQMGRIRGYLEIMLKLAESMIKSYLQVYTSGNPHYLHHRDREGKGGLKKDTKEIFERILKLLGAITGETALRNLTDLSMGNSSRWKGKKRAMDRTQGGGILASLARMRGNREGELEAELKGLWEVSKEVETVVAEIDLLDSSESEKEEEEERNVPTISEQLGSIVGFLDLADLVHSTTSRPLAKSFDNDLSLSVPLLSHYISTHLLPIIPPASLLLATDSTRQCTISTTSRQVKRAVLMSLRTSRESGGQLDLTEELEQEIEKRWRALEAESRENGRPQLSSRVSREEDQAREFRRKRPSPKNQRPYPRLLPSLQCSSDSDVDDLDTISPPPPFVTSRPLSRLPLDRPSSLLQPRPSNRPITTASSEPDELALLPPPRRLLPTSLTHRRKSSSSPQKQKRKRSRIAVQLPLSPSPDAPSEPTYDDNSSEERSISPRTVSPPWKERPAAKKLERLEEQDPAPLKKRRLESHVRTHSAPQKLLRDLDVMSRGVGPENDVEEEEEDELMMSF